MRGTEEGRQRVQKAKERLDAEMITKVEKLILEGGGGGSHPKRTRIGEPATQQAAASSSSAIAPQAQMSDQSKRAVERAGDDGEQRAKKLRGDQEMEISQVERLMQEDFQWNIQSVSDMCEGEPGVVRQAVTDMAYYDENTGEVFDQRLVREAEAEELKRFEKMGVYTYADRETALHDPEGIFVKVKWVRVNKGSKSKPKMKCRLVAQELAYGTRMDELYANTPSLSCVKMAMVYAAEEGNNRKLMTLDVKSAFLYGAARRKIYIELPSADPQAGGSKVGLLRKALYGTRDAPQIWQHEVRKTLKQMGFRQSTLQPSVYVHDEMEIMLVVHVDDFLVAASQEALDWVYNEMSKVYELKKTVVSSCPEDAHETSYLNRKIRWDVQNWMSYEGDDKHTELLLREWGMVQCKSVSSTLTKELVEQIGEGARLGETEERRVRRSIARVNFMSQDRPDLCCAARILSKHMSAPTEGTRSALQHVVKYLKGHRRCVNKVYGSIPADQYKLVAFCDSDWANDKTDRKSCSGGVLFIAGVPISFWSKSQSNIALSSGEAELNSSVKAISELLGVMNLWEELFSCQLEASLRVDSSACRGMLLRSGTGRVKHLSTKQLWVQAVVEVFPLDVVKVGRSANCADMLTHCLPEGEASSQLRKMNFVCVA